MSNYPSIDAQAFAVAARPQSFLPMVGKPVALSGVDAGTADTLKMLNSKSVRIAAPVGSLAGIGYALAKNKRVGGIIGFTLLGSLIGITAGRVIYEAVER